MFLRRLLEACFLCTIAAEQCIDGEDPKPSEVKTSCACDRHDAHEDKSVAPASCLLNSDEPRVAPYFVKPYAKMPTELKMLEDNQFWEAQPAYYANATDSSGLSKCPEGFARLGKAPPEPVPAGSYLYKPTLLPKELYHFMGCTQVRKCPQGYYCKKGQPPKACGKGSLCSTTGLSRPRPCPEGYYCPTSLFNLKCFKGSFCPPKSQVPRSCRKGYYCPNPCEEVICPAGKWCPEASYEPRDCQFWNRCPEGSSDVNWYRLGISMAITVPLVFELSLRYVFRRPVHEQTPYFSLRGMTAPCLILLTTTVVMAWILMPWVALVKSILLVYTIASVAIPHRVRVLRFALVGVGAVVLMLVQGVLAAVWQVYIPVCLFAGFLFAAANAAYQRRGFGAICCLSLSFALGDCFLFVSGVSFTTEEKQDVTIAQAVLALGHLWLFLLALIFLFYAEVARQQHLHAQQALLHEVEMEERPSYVEPGSPSNRIPGISFQLEDVGLNVRGTNKSVLSNISLEILADSSCALMGPSGSGKSSLLNVLTGRALQYGEVSGQMSANNEPIPEGLESNLKTKNASGFVPQDDVMHTELTVYENVYFSARLRLPPDTDLKDTAARVETALKDVGISHVKDTLVGNAEIRGISGGQRKRCSIAMELVGEPSVLFLDEPTSGLDAAAAHSMVKLLCDKSSLRCTTIAVIHQPRWQTLECFDQVVLLATGGFLVYSGAIADSVTYFTEALKAKIPAMANPADCFLDFIDTTSSDASSLSPQELAAKWQIFRPRGAAPADEEGGTAVESFRSVADGQLLPPLSSYEKFRPGVSETFWTLYLRCCLQVCRLWKHRITNLALVTAFLCLVRVMLGDEGNFEEILTKLGIAQSMLMLPVCIHSMYVFSCDRLERQREDTAGIPILSQVLAKDFCHFVEVLLFAVVWTGVYGPFAHVSISPLALLRLAVAQCYLAFGISFLLSVNLPSQSTATVTIMLLLVVAQLCSGVDMIAWGNVHRALKGVGWVIFTLSPSFYTVERILPIMLNEGCTEPVRRAVCDGYLRQKGVSCEPPFHHSDGIFERAIGKPTFLEDMKQSYIFLSSDVQLVMFGLAVRVITLFQMLLRAGRANGDWRMRLVCRIAVALVATFLIFTIPMTSSSWNPNYI